MQGNEEDRGMTLTKRAMAQMGLKVAIMTTCLCFVLDGRHPPAQAQMQERRQAVYLQPVVTAEDAGQDHDIAALNKHVESTDATVQRQWAREQLDTTANTTAIQQNATEIAGIRGEERIFSAIIGLLSGGGLLLNFSNRRKAA